MVVNGGHGNNLVRRSHWVRPNEQNRIPKRWVAFDTEARTARKGDEETQSWRLGAAVAWRRDTKRTEPVFESVFDSPVDLWVRVTDFCVPETRTVVTAHNLGYDVRISQALEILPRLGWRLEWSNLDRNVSAMVWRSDRGTLVFSDLFTWLPYPLRDIGVWVGMDKLRMPALSSDGEEWRDYCLRDAQIVRAAVSDLVGYIETQDLGNWQPTGAGSAYSMWRHRFMPERVLVHDDEAVLQLERKGMHTGRAEAWRHGKVRDGVWHEVDMRSAYTWIAYECALPAKLKYTGDKLTTKQFLELNKTYALLCEIEIRTKEPVVPHDNGERTVWPIGRFKTTVWDTEIQQALSDGAQIQILRYAAYVRKPVLGNWAEYILDSILGERPMESEVVKKWLKHCGRALIGRLSLRIPMWEYYGENVQGITGISYDKDVRTGKTTRFLHVGREVFYQSERKEAKDSLPQITGWIMAECRMRLWRAMKAAGLENVAHVDTDCVLVNDTGLKRLREHYGATFDTLWQIKGRHAYVDVHGPRNYRVGKDRKISGVPKKAREVSPGEFAGELWYSIGNDLESGRPGTVTIKQSTWNVRMTDPRRLDAPGAGGMTAAIYIP